MVLVDTNILVDVFSSDHGWSAWSEEQLLRLGASDDLAINPIIYAELAPLCTTAAELERVLGAHPLKRLTLPYEAAFLAGRAFVNYRRRGGQRRSPLPDFYIGAHAQAAGLTLLTRDAARYRTYFPRVRLIAPE
jgi:hypothetical protein